MSDVIRTKRLTLRRRRPGDLDRMFALFADWEVVRWLSSPPWPYTRPHADDFARAISNPGGNAAETEFAIAHDDDFIGAVGVRIRPASHLQRGAGPNLGYWLGRPYWGRGYMTEALAALIAHVFATRPEDAIYAGVFTGNDASLRVQEKLGFVRDGETMLRSNPRGGEFPHINTVLMRARFAGLAA